MKCKEEKKTVFVANQVEQQLFGHFLSHYRHESRDSAGAGGALECKSISFFFFLLKNNSSFKEKKKKKHTRGGKNRINLLNLISFGGKRKSPKLAAIRREGGGA